MIRVKKIPFFVRVMTHLLRFLFILFLPIYTLKVQFEPRNPSESVVVCLVDPNTGGKVTVLNKLNSKSKVLDVAFSLKSKS